MAQSSTVARSIVLAIATVLLASLSAFFLFYTGRLLYVTNWLRATRVGGQGAYVGAFAFPVLAICFGWGAWRCARALRGS